jgi:hypothetical protein
MVNNRNRLYLILIITCFAGYFWLYYNSSANITVNNSVEVCLIKHVTNIPCPSCGSTRSIISMINGNFIDALNINPIGYIIAAIMLIAPIWIIIDIIKRDNTLYDFYQIIENQIKKPKLAIPLIFLLLINWIWNISKGL